MAPGGQVKKRLGFLLSPWAVFLSIAAGILNGIFFKGFAHEIAPFGEMFLGAMQMCVIPILICAVTTNTARMLSHREMARNIRRLLLVMSTGLVVASCIGALAAMISHLGTDMSPGAQAALGHLVSNSEHLANSGTTPSASLLDFIREMVPSNIFTAIVETKNLPILVFSILLGISLGVAPNKGGVVALAVIDDLLDAFLRIINGVMYLLPLGMFCLLSMHISRIGPDIILSLAPYIGIVAAGMLALVLFSSFAIWRATGVTPLRSIVALKEAYLVALGTSSSFATMPAAMQCLEKNLDLDPEATRLVFPLGVCLNPWGSAFFFTFTTLFLAHLYGIHLTSQSLLIAVFGSILVSIAAAGVPAVSSFAVMGMVLGPLGLPAETAIVVVLVTTPILDPLITLANISGVCATTAMIARKKTRAPVFSHVRKRRRLPMARSASAAVSLRKA